MTREGIAPLYDENGFWDKIVSIDFIGYRKTWDLEEPIHHCYIANGIRVHNSGKTTTIAVKAIWFACTHPKTLTLIVSPSLRQSMIMMDRVHGFLFSLPEKIKRALILKLQRTVVWFKNGSQIVALPCSIHLLRGYAAHLICIDEGAFIRDDETLYYNVLYPMLATTDGTLIVSSTPWGKDSVFYRMNNDPNFSKHIVTWKDVVEAGLVKQEFIEEMRRVLPESRFKAEFEAEFVSDENSWLRQDLIAQCIDPFLDEEYIDENEIMTLK